MDPINTKRIPQIIQFLQTQNQTTRRDDKSTFYKPYYLTCDTNFFFFFFEVKWQKFFSKQSKLYTSSKLAQDNIRHLRLKGFWNNIKYLAYKTCSRAYTISSQSTIYLSIYTELRRKRGHSSTQIPLEFLLRASFAITWAAWLHKEFVKLKTFLKCDALHWMSSTNIPKGAKTFLWIL